MERAHYLYVGTVDDVKRKLSEMVKACNPTYLVWWIEQGFLPFAVVQQKLELFSEKIMPLGHPPRVPDQVRARAGAGAAGKDELHGGRILLRCAL
jgi:hypothetical protein